jgi:ubiquinone/menaquinone biosynthesis C-methylase UbiE
LPIKRARQAGNLPLDLPAGKKVLHVGCGTAPLPDDYSGFTEVRLDINPEVKPDIVGSITSIPMNSEGFDAVYSSHNLEHLHASEVEVALQEFRRMLKPGGEVRIEVPDVEAVAEEIPKIGINGVLYQSQSGPITAADVLYGYHVAIDAGNKFYEHKTGFTQNSLEQSLLSASFTDVRVDRNRDNYALVAYAIKA